MNTEKRDFTGHGHILAELTDGSVIECVTYLIAQGDYASWYEPAPVEWMQGWTEVEFSIDEDSVEPMYPDEFDSDVDFPNNIEIKRVIKVLDDVDWRLEDFDTDWQVA